MPKCQAFFSPQDDDDVEVPQWRARVAGKAKNLGGKRPETRLQLVEVYSFKATVASPFAPFLCCLRADENR